MAFTAINGVTIHHRSAGRADATPVVFCNSLGTDARIWDEVIALLADRFRLISYDKRGHGLSDVPDGPYGIGDHVADLVGLADKLGLRRFALVGISVGGLVAQAVAARHPGRIDALILCDTAARIGSDAFWNARIAKVIDSGMASLADTIMERWFSTAFRCERPAELAGWRNMVLHADPNGYAATCATLRDTDLTAELDAIVAPTLVIAGAEDVSTPPALVRETAGQIDDARFELIAGTGHLPPLERPGVTARLIRNFLEEVGLG
jgi:3-oxoadipate enol-lactonase